MIAPALSAEGWLTTGDGFSLCPKPLSALLLERGIWDTGISEINKADTESYYDDWHLYQICRGSTVYGLVKLREQEHDYVPGFSDRDDPSVTVSFVAFPLVALTALPRGYGPEAVEMRRFISAFRDVTDRFPQRHDPILQAYFSDPASEGSYLIAEAYVRKLLALFPDGHVPFPDHFFLASQRLLQGFDQLNRAAGRCLIDTENQRIHITNPSAPTLEEQQALLAFHTGNLSYNSFASEVKFHADALVRWQARVPYAGRKFWYRAALRADMGFGPESRLYSRILCPYYQPESRLCREQEALHGKR